MSWMGIDPSHMDLQHLMRSRRPHAVNSWISWLSRDPLLTNKILEWMNFDTWYIINIITRDILKIGFLLQNVLEQDILATAYIMAI